MLLWLPDRYLSRSGKQLVGKYQWSMSGKQQYIHELLLLQKSSVDIVAAKDCVVRACLSSWWDWNGGSRPFYWRWPERCQGVCISTRTQSKQFIGLDKFGDTKLLQLFNSVQ